MIVACVEPLRDLKDKSPGPGRGHKTRLYNNDVIERQGTSQTYLIRRLKRDRPDIAERLARGEFKSARAAAIEAGIIKPDTPFIVICKQLKKLNKDELLRIIDKAENLINTN